MYKISELIKGELCFFPELGYGFYPVPPHRPYDENYFEKYQRLADTEMGREITQSRMDLVNRHYSGELCDVGIGCGQFVESMGCYGYDVNSSGIEWLKKRNKYRDIYRAPVGALSFWDVLEHIDEPEKAVAMAKEWVFVSIPFFESAEHITSSRHFRKDEHIHYWTHNGFIRWFSLNGFECEEFNDSESELGREGIRTYAFRRVRDANQIANA